MNLFDQTDKLTLRNSLNIIIGRLIENGKLLNPVDLRNFLECLMGDKRFNYVAKSPSILRHLSKLYGWTMFHPGVKRNQEIGSSITGRRFSQQVLKRMWIRKYCTMCGKHTLSPLKVKKEHADELCLFSDNQKTLEHVLLCKNCVRMMTLSQGGLEEYLYGLVEYEHVKHENGTFVFKTKVISYQHNNTQICFKKDIDDLVGAFYDRTKELKAKIDKYETELEKMNRELVKKRKEPLDSDYKKRVRRRKFKEEEDVPTQALGPP